MPSSSEGLRYRSDSKSEMTQHGQEEEEQQKQQQQQQHANLEHPVYTVPVVKLRFGTEEYIVEESVVRASSTALGGALDTLDPDGPKTLSTHALEPNLVLAVLNFIHEDKYHVLSTVAQGYKRRTPGEILFHTNMYCTFRFLQIPRGAAYALREVRRTCLNIYSVGEFVGVAREMCRPDMCSSLFARGKAGFAPRRVLLETARLGMGRLVQEREVQGLMRESEVFRREMLEMVGKMLAAYGNVWPGLTWEEMVEPRGRGRRRMIYKGEYAKVKEGEGEGSSVDEESEGSEWSDLRG